ncbi:autophagy-related protein 101-like isoform X2 [Solanum stenotomum]|uniref:autophagy-related protein 101-like isoform X2 n=1 Tax=Solanum stenotomum TaxID=172797 RepID=UPI0020D12B14|nr:autophagy-related protein 101-like isoform X2 [Solanum stenotomum]
MNCEVFNLKELDVEQFEIQDVLQCILHTIMFHRASGLIYPKNVDLELFEITYMQCNDVVIERKIDEKITQFIDKVKKHPNQKHQICVSFYESKNKQTLWFTKKVEHRYWEHWYVNLNVAHHPKPDSGKSRNSKVVNPEESAPDKREARHSGLELSLREVLFQIINFVKEKKDHIPSIENLEGASFPFEITISRDKRIYMFNISYPFAQPYRGK